MTAPPGFALRENGEMWVHRRFDSILRNAGLVSFDDFMAGSAATMIRERGYASNARLLLEGREFHLKRYRFPRLGVALRGGLKGNPAGYSGLAELRNYLRFQEAGFLTCEPVAGGDRSEGRRGAGFILTEGIQGEVPLEDIVPHRYAPPLGPDRARERRRLARELGGWVRKLHRSGMHPRDLYLCHLFAPPEEPTAHFRLIDLHKARAGVRVGPRRVVRDLAALHHSSPQGIVSGPDRLRVLLAATGRARLDRETKAIARRVMARAARMERHEARQGKLWTLLHAGVPPLR